MVGMVVMVVMVGCDIRVKEGVAEGSAAVACGDGVLEAVRTGITDAVTGDSSTTSRQAV